MAKLSQMAAVAATHMKPYISSVGALVKLSRLAMPDLQWRQAPSRPVTLCATVVLEHAAANQTALRLCVGLVATSSGDSQSATMGVLLQAVLGAQQADGWALPSATPCTCGATHLMVDVTLAPSRQAPRNSQMAATTTTCPHTAAPCQVSASRAIVAASMQARISSVSNCKCSGPASASC